MIKKDLILIGNKPNFFSFPQVTIDGYAIEDTEKELFYSSVKIFSDRATTHISYPYVKHHLSSKLHSFDIVRMPRYPLPVTFNETTRKAIINISPTGHRSISSIESRDLYTLVFMGHCFAKMKDIQFSRSESIPVIEYLTAMYLKIFAKRYGLTGSYSKLIPELRYLVAIYVLVAFFDMDQKEAYNEALKTSKFNRKELQIELDEYDFKDITGLVRAFKDSGTLPDLNLYKFISTMMQSFSVFNLVIIEDVIRFYSLLMSSTVNGNTIIPSFIQSFQKEAYDRIVLTVQKVI